MPDRPSHPYGLDPAEEAPARPLPASSVPSTRRAARGRGPVVPRSATALDTPAPSHTAFGWEDTPAGGSLFGDAVPAAPGQAGRGDQGGHGGGRRSASVTEERPEAEPPAGAPGGRRARREAESARREAKHARGPHVTQVAAAALGVLAVLGGVMVAMEKIPGDPAASTSAIASTTDVSELPTVSSDSIPLAEPSAAGAPASARRKLADQRVDVSKVINKDRIAKAAAAVEKKKAKKPAAKVGGRSTGSGAADGVKLGVFRGTSPAEVQAFGSWLGRDVDYAMDFSSRTNWDEIANPHSMLDAWKGSGFRMVYATAMLPTQDGSATMAAGARGEYDEYFRTLARNLVDAGQGDAILRLGWEFNLSASRWHPDSKANFIGYWRHIVTAMRSRGVEVVDAPADLFASTVTDTYLAMKAAGRL